MSSTAFLSDYLAAIDIAAIAALTGLAVAAAVRSGSPWLWLLLVAAVAWAGSRWLGLI